VWVNSCSDSPYCEQKKAKNVMKRKIGKETTSGKKRKEEPYRRWGKGAQSTLKVRQSTEKKRGDLTGKMRSETASITGPKPDKRGTPDGSVHKHPLSPALKGFLGKLGGPRRDESTQTRDSCPN